ncbi:MAG: hypothetical protein AAB909_02685 [Patescibacteria group bacterium]
MGKKRAAIIGSSDEENLKAKKAVKREQKKLREGDVVEKPVEASAEPTAETVILSETKDPVSPKKQLKESQPRSKPYQAAKAKIDSERTYSLSDALPLLRSVGLTKFDPTVELHIVMKSAPSNKLVVSLPHMEVKERKIAIATDDVIKQIEAGKIDFEVLIATPSQMGKLVKFAKILGPRGLMPNPKSGTVTDKPEEAAKKLAADTSVTLKLDKGGPIFHTTVGKLSLEDKKLSENIMAVLSPINASNLHKVVLKSTMSPAIKIVI